MKGRLCIELLTTCLIIVLLFSLTLMSQVRAQGNAEITRTRNLQYFELEPNDIDVSRYRNLQFSQLDHIDVDVTRYRNLQYYGLEPTDVDVTRFRNLQFFELADAGDFIININLLVTTDQGGNPKTSFILGDIVQFNFIVENYGSRTLSMGLIFTEVLDPISTPVFLSYSLADLPSGLGQQFGVGYGIPTGASLGTYTVKIMVFTDWPSNGGIGLDIETSAFNVIA